MSQIAPHPAAARQGFNTDSDLHRKRASLLGHDIRTAVSDIVGGLSLMDLSDLDDPSRLQGERIRSAAAQLVRLTDEVLALYTGEAVQATRVPAYPLRTLLDSVAMRWRANALERGVRFVSRRDADLPAEIGTEQGALERILSNLLGNAIKYSEGGTVYMKTTMGSHETLCFEIRDSGPGFSSGAIARLFEYRGRCPENTKPGDGLGLHIVRDLTDRINARMHVSNHPEGGAQVSIILPRTTWAPGLTGPGGGNGLPDLSGWRILVAEDNATNQLMLRQMLETLGAQCEIAADGHAAQEALRRENFDLALIDIEMPRRSGIDVIADLRGRAGRNSDIPVLAVTAFVLSASREEIYTAGADGILPKPILSLEAFGEAIGLVLKKRDPQQDLYPNLPSPAAYCALSLDRLLALSPDGGHELLRHLQDDFSDTENDLRKGFAARDCGALRARSHVLISLAGAIGAKRMQARAEALNQAAHENDWENISAILPGLTDDIEGLVTRLSKETARRFYGHAR
ncbi:histidine kinase/DNA gyrase B/HSP90-like ATPase [Rhodovulum imhoffii]|uniref:histidine kinase n=1 Tax=Rhodovulum imhoffii TaxID=365340 RepID=A0A2T5BSY7_9RHOB|nr:response regulator [Rhodovulum imhoffii]MBK5932678.1 hypothetical protein [Rhodovulum imhoffii]PTN02506.1 histidine kinase/DNA gyrase B/HSP90-like ATPase [Rhodovulum imhoffii]